MSVNSQLDELLLRWEEQQRQGQPVSAEKLCRDCPGLLDELRLRIGVLQAMNSVLEPAAATPTENYSPSAGQTLSVPPGPPRSTRVPGYEILGELGRGGMGVVYKARQTSLGRIVALKMILAGAHAGREQRDRFRGEAEAAAQLQHPNIVQVYEIGEQDGCPYFSLEFVDGRCLDDIVYNSPQPPRTAAALLATMARAVHYAHQRGIVHRDLKPGNILLSLSHEPEENAAALPSGSWLNEAIPKITDFGLAKRLGEDQGHTRTGDIMGTPSYMAPEQAAGNIKEIGPATDIYALGAILYEMLTGVPPFDAANSWDTISQVLSAEPLSPCRRNPKVPRDLATICLKCLEKEPQKRYATAAALADDLRRFLNDEPIAARPAGLVERTVKWVWRHPAQAALAVVGIVAVLAMMFGVTAWAMMEHQGREASQALAEAKQSEVAASQRALVRLNVANGIHYLDDGDFFASLVWFARALKQEEDAAPERKNRHRLRITAVLRQCPRLDQLWFHKDRVNDVAFSPDGQWIVTASDDETAHVWNVRTGQPRFAVPLKHDFFIWRASFSADGRSIVTASADKTAKLWDAQTGQLRWTLKHEGPVHDAQFSPDSQHVVTASADKMARIWNVRTGQLVVPLKGHQAAVIGVSFDPKGDRLVTASVDTTAILWDTATGKAVHVLKGHQKPLTYVCFNRAGTQVATASDDQTARVWQVSDGGEVTTLPHLGAVLHVAFSPDGKQLATGSTDLAARIWNAQTGQRSIPALRHSSAVRSVAFSPDGTQVVTASEDNTVRVWDSATGRPLTPPLTHNGNVSRSCFSPTDNHRIATADDDTTARIYDLVPPRPLLHHEGPVYQLSFSPESTGRRIVTASGDRMARIWDAATARLLITLKGHTGPVRTARFSPDGSRVLTASDDTLAKIWDAASGQVLLTLKGHRGPVRTARFSPDGSRVLTASDDGTARLWDAAGRSLTILTDGEDHPEEEVFDAVFSPDGRRVATGSADRTARLWDVATGRQIGPTMRHHRRVVRVVFSPDGRRLATASYDRTARLWNASSGAPLLTLQHAGPVFDVAFSPDGSRLATGSDDNTTRIWSAATGAPLLPPLWHGGGVGVARFSRDGQRLTTASRDNTGRVWDAATGEPLTPALRGPSWGAVTDAAFYPTGDRIVTASLNHTAEVWELKNDINWQPEEIEHLAELLAGYRIAADNSLVPLDALELRSRWNELCGKHPEQLGVRP